MKDTIRIDKIVKYEPLLHVLFWAMVLLSPYVKYLGKEGGYPNTLLHELNALSFHIAFSYFIYFFILRTAIRGKSLLIIVVATALACAHEFFDSFFHGPDFQHYTWKRLVSHLISYTTFGVVFYALHISKQAYQKQRELLLLHEEHQVANLALLKAQVTPHFLFNTLNTIYRKVLEKDKESAHLLLMLSDNIRYFLKEGQKEQVSLREEINQIESFIKLQNRRWKDKIVVRFLKEGINDQVRVAPLLFIPFVENAFKYTSQLRGQGHKIEIAFLMDRTHLTFSCLNPFYEGDVSLEENNKSTGIGIQNVRRRLQLIYPDHYLETEEFKGEFIVTVKIPIC
ncbi:MAG: histidine kinase [Bacteroidota bacterium]